MGNHFILMADIINSRDLNGREAMSMLKTVTNEVNKKFGKKILSPLTITLGDEFQGVIKSIKDAILIIFHLEELLIKSNASFKMRYVVYFGEIETPLNSSSAHEMLGDGLSSARFLLTGMKKSKYRFCVDARESGMGELLTPALKIYQFFVDSWSLKDYTLVSLFLELKDYKKVARQLNKDISLMWRRQKSLHIEEYMEIKKLLILLSETKT